MKNFNLVLIILMFASQAFGQANKILGVEGQSYGSPALKFETPPPPSASTVMAETVIWGDNPGEGDFDGGLNGWTIEQENDTLELWYWDDDATIVGGFFEQTTLDSETAANGVMAFNADYLTTGGDEESQPQQPYPVYVGDLISPTIDMTDALDPQLLFTQAFRGFTGDGDLTTRGALMAYSIDDGVTWSDFQTVNDDLDIRVYSDNPSYKRINIPETIGVAAVRFKFRFSGNFYFWMIDDVKVVERPAHDLAISTAGVAVAEYFIAPVSQVYPVYFGGYVSNIGGANQSNVNLSATVDVYDLDNNIITDDAYSGSTSIEVLEAGKTDSLLLFDMTDSFTPTGMENLRRYEIEYQLSQDSTDASPVDNSNFSSFYIYDGYYSKAVVDNNFNPIRTGAFRANNSTSYEYGVHMYIPNGGSLRAEEVKFAYAANGYLEGTDVNIILREWNDADQDAMISDGELEIVGFNTHSYTTEGNYDVVTLSLLDVTTAEQGVILKNNTHYILTGQYEGSGDIFMAVDQNIEYDPSIDASLARYLETGDADLVRYADVLYNDGEWFMRGFNIVGVPSLVMLTSDIEIAIEDAQGVPVQVALHPNPVSDVLNVALKTEISSDNWNVSISDVSGRSILWNRTAKQTDFPLQININELAKGTYMLTLENNGQIHTERFVKR